MERGEENGDHGREDVARFRDLEKTCSRAGHRSCGQAGGNYGAAVLFDSRVR
jgi:hypothetical protein